MLLPVGQFGTVTVQFSGRVDQAPTVTVSNGSITTVGAVVNNGGNSYSIQVMGLAAGTATVTFTTTGGSLPVTVTSGPIIIGPVASAITIGGPGLLGLGATVTVTATANGAIDPGSIELVVSPENDLTVVFLGPTTTPNQWIFSVTGVALGVATVTLNATTNGTLISGLMTVDVITPVTGTITMTLGTGSNNE